MRIALLSRRFDPAGGGTERDLMVTAGILARAGHRIVIYADEVRASIPDLEVRRVGGRALPRSLAMARFAYAAPAAARRDGAELVLSFARTIGADLLRSGGGAHVSYVRESRRWRGAPRALAMRVAPYHRVQMLVERLGFRSRSLKRVIAVSQMVADDLALTFGIPAQKMVTLYNGVNLEHFKPAPGPAVRSEIRIQFGIPRAAALAVFVGNGFARKGLRTVLAAWEGLRGDPYLIVVGNDRARGSFERRAMRLGIASRVIFAGARPDVVRFFQAADLLAFPSLFEPFGNVALEAMACGIPAVTSAWCGVAEVMPPELQATVVDNPSDEIEVAIRLGVTLKERETLAPIALAVARQFTWARHARELDEIIESVKREL
ncbi:MAG TPA: glycosyltransferase family 4 protein [Candidatus Binataceae bacterium]|nr:glycosyltransferase family 4 protein [Candidatus Binataceae bacterium]